MFRPGDAILRELLHQRCTNEPSIISLSTTAHMTWINYQTAKILTGWLVHLCWNNSLSMAPRCRNMLELRTMLEVNVGYMVESSWNVMAHGDAREGKWKGKLANGVVSQYPLHYLGTWSITTAGTHISSASSRLNWLHCRFKRARPFCRKTKSGFCACTITSQT
jgi:hypothetical protein